MSNLLQKKLPKRYHPAEVFGLKPHPSTDIQLIRSLVVSCTALAVDFGLLVTLKELFNVYYLIAVIIGAFAGLFTNYLLSVKWVFPNRKLSNITSEFTIFAVINFTGLLFNVGIIYFLVESQHIDYRWAKAVATVLVFFWNFIARKKILF